MEVVHIITEPTKKGENMECISKRHSHNEWWMKLKRSIWAVLFLTCVTWWWYMTSFLWGSKYLHSNRTATLARTANPSPHGKVGAHGSPACARQRALPCKWSMRTATSTLPSEALPGVLCRASAHSNAFAGRTGSFAVRLFAWQRPVFR
jgi:hypothetical protein